MIDDAEALNSRKQNEGIGLVNAKDDEDEVRLGERDDERLEEMIRSKKPQRGYEEEKKDEVENVEDFDAPTGKFSGLSASRKIAEMGLGRVNSTPDKMNPSATKAVTGAEDQVKHSAFNRILSEGPVDKAA